MEDWPVNTCLKIPLGGSPRRGITGMLLALSRIVPDGDSHEDAPEGQEGPPEGPSSPRIDDQEQPRSVRGLARAAALSPSSRRAIAKAGGQARARALSPAHRRAVAQVAARTRWTTRSPDVRERGC